MSNDIKHNKKSIIANLDFPDAKQLDTFWRKRYDKKFHTEILGRLNRAEYSKIKDNISKWYELQDEILHDLFTKKQSDCTVKTTFLRVKLLNEFYSTNVPDICIYNVAKSIATNKKLHQQILKPKNNDEKYEAVTTISNILANDVFVGYKISINKTMYSFATKYCHFCNPKDYSIYDQYVAKLLSDYIGEGRLNCIYNNKKDIMDALKNYKTFIEYVDLFVDKCREYKKLPKTYKNIRAKVDNYLWLAGMMIYKKDSTVAEHYKTKG